MSRGGHSWPLVKLLISFARHIGLLYNTATHREL